MKKHGTGPFLYPTSILLIKRQAPVVQLPRSYSFQKYHDLPLTTCTSCEDATVVFVRKSPEYPTLWTQSESNSATYKKNGSSDLSGFGFEVRKIPLRFKQHLTSGIIWSLNVV